VRISRLIFYMLSKKDTIRPSVTKLLLNSYVQTYVNEMPKFLKVTTNDHRYPKNLGPEEKADSAAAETVNDRQAELRKKIAEQQQQRGGAPPPEPKPVSPPPEPANAEGGALNDKGTLKESQACTPEEMHALTDQLKAIPAAEQTDEEPQKEAEPATDDTGGDDDQFEDQYESDFEEYEEEEAEKGSPASKKAKLEAELGAETFAKVCRILHEDMANNEEAAQRQLDNLLTEQQLGLLPELNAYVIENMKHEMASSK
jgi:hypothetical protein